MKILGRMIHFWYIAIGLYHYGNQYDSIFIVFWSFMLHITFYDFRFICIYYFAISNRGTTAGEQTPFIVLCMYVTLRTTKFTHSDDTMILIDTDMMSI